MVADSGEKALDCVRDQAFDAVMMDIQLPDMDGYETTRRIRDLPNGQTVPIIAMTANTMEEDRISGLKAGMEAYMTKPVEPAVLFATLSKILNKPLAFDANQMNQAHQTWECLLEDLPGINTRTALERLGGNLPLLKDLIRDFAGENTAPMDRLREWAGQGRKDLILSEAHQLKGVSRNLSADGLADSLAELEKTVKSLEEGFSPDDPGLVSGLARTRIEFERILETAGRLEDRSKEPARAGILQQAAIPGPLLEQAGKMAAVLKPLLDGNSLKAKDYTRQFSRHLAGTPFETGAITLEAQVKRFDFEKAQKTFETLHSGILSALADAAAI
nr:response regulator [Desulfobacula sp.]